MSGVVALVGAALCLGTAPAAATTQDVARWEMNEARGATVMRDSVSGLNGSIGVGGYDHSVLATGLTNSATGIDQLGDPAGTRGYGWRGPVPAGRDDRRLVVVPHQAALDPQAGDFAVEARFVTGQSSANVVQKGQSSPGRPMWKMEVAGGKASCLFRSPSGSRAIGTPITPHQWHTVRCELDRQAGGDAVSIVLDGVRRTTRGTPLGVIASDQAVTVGGKRGGCTSPSTCDYFVGKMNWVRVQAGPA